MKKLRIAQFVTSLRSMPTPDDAIWAPIDLALDIAYAMKKKGHSTTFYTPASTKIPFRTRSGKLKYGIYDKAFQEIIKKERKIMPYGIHHQTLTDQYLMSLMIEDANKGMYDVLHAHTERVFPLAKHCRVPIVTTLHDPINPYAARAYGYFKGQNQHLISISRSQRVPAPGLDYAANIYNGTNTEQFAFNPKPSDTFLFAGRLVPQKGVETAIAAAKATRSKLDIYGRYWDPKYMAKIKKSCTKNVRYRGFITRERIPKVYARSKALLMPIKWPEPFGLVMTEAMSCGTPVIAFDKGSVREVVKDGVTGFIVKSEKGMIAAMKKIDSIDRQACRTWVEERFSKERMCDDYEKLYLKAAQWKRNR